MENTLIEVKNLEKYFEISGGLFSKNKSIVKAVDGISFDIPFGSSLGLVVDRVVVVKQQLQEP